MYEIESDYCSVYENEMLHVANGYPPRLRLPLAFADERLSLKGKAKAFQSVQIFANCAARQHTPKAVKGPSSTMTMTRAMTASSLSISLV